MNSRAARTLRGAAIAAIATVTAAASHTLGGGTAPSVLFCAVLFVFAVPVATVVATTRPSMWRTILAVGSAQLSFHAAFALVGDIGIPAVVRGTMSAGMHAHDVGLLWTPNAALAPDTGMTVMHTVAALVSAALIWRGEAALAAIVDWVARAARRVLVPASAVEQRCTPWFASVPRAVAALPPGLGRRGPPPLSSPSFAA